MPAGLRTKVEEFTEGHDRVVLVCMLRMQCAWQHLRNRESCQPKELRTPPLNLRVRMDGSQVSDGGCAQDRLAQREGDLLRRAQQALQGSSATGSAQQGGLLPWQQQQVTQLQHEQQRHMQERQQQQQQQSQAQEAKEQKAAAERSRRDAAARQVGNRCAVSHLSWRTSLSSTDSSVCCKQQVWYAFPVDATIANITQLAACCSLGVHRQSRTARRRRPTSTGERGRRMPRKTPSVARPRRSAGPLSPPPRPPSARSNGARRLPRRRGVDCLSCCLSVRQRPSLDNGALCMLSSGHPKAHDLCPASSDLPARLRTR